MRISIIAAMDRNRLIGSNNQLPWHLPADLKFFKQNTLNKPVIMGRKTYESIGKPLPNRTNIIVSRQPDFVASGCIVVPSIESALDAAAGVEEIMIMGGANLYEQFLDRADRLYLTQVKGKFEGDAWFPEIDWSQWTEVQREDHKADEKNSHDYSFIVYDRRQTV